MGVELLVKLMALLDKLENGRQSADTVSLRTVGSQLDEESSLGSDSELNGFASSRETDKYGFIGGAQKYSAESAEDVAPDVLRQREVKWLDMLSNWDKWISKRFTKLFKASTGGEETSGEAAMSERNSSIVERQGMALLVRRKSEERTKRRQIQGAGQHGRRSKVDRHN